MGLFGGNMGHIAHHPERKPKFDQPLTWENFRAIFDGCADFGQKQLTLQGWDQPVPIGWLDGMVRGERLNDYVLRPLAAWPLPHGGSITSAIVEGGVWNQDAQVQETLDETVEAVLNGSCAIFLPDGVITCMVATEEKRAVTEPQDEAQNKGAKDGFVESVRTNTSLLRRRMRTPELQIQRFLVGRRTHTPVELLWLKGVASEQMIGRIQRKLDEIDEDGLLTTGELEEYLTDPKATAFPRVLFTERPDRVCQGLLNGRAAILVDGIPLGCLLPGDVSQFMKAPQDKSYHWAVASSLLLLRYLCLVLTLLLPGFYISVAEYHFELIPTKLAMSIIASKQDVPFPTAFEVIGLLAAFEILQEAGLRLPKTIGQTVSIIGGLVVGQAAVDAKIVSPVVVIVVAVAGIAGFTIPNQDFSNALRVWRLLLAGLASLMGIFGLMAGTAFLIAHLASLEDFGVPYLVPFAPRERNSLESHPVLRKPVPEVKLRPSELCPENRRKRT